MSQGEVYLVGVLEGCYKIGRSGDSEKRLLSYSPKLPVTLTILHRITTDDSLWLEQSLHAAFVHRRAAGEWFRLTDDDIAVVRDLVAVRRDDGLPARIESLIRQHYPGGLDVLPVVDPKPNPPPASLQIADEAEVLVDPKLEKVNPNPLRIIQWPYDWGYQSGTLVVWQEEEPVPRGLTMAILRVEGEPTKWFPTLAYTDENGVVREFIAGPDDRIGEIDFDTVFVGRGDPLLAADVWGVCKATLVDPGDIEPD